MIPPNEFFLIYLVLAMNSLHCSFLMCCHNLVKFCSYLWENRIQDAGSFDSSNNHSKFLGDVYWWRNTDLHSNFELYVSDNGK